MIDKKTGEIIISDQILIGQNSSKKGVFSLHLGEIRNYIDHKNGWAWLTEKNVYLENQYFILNFGFFEDKLKEIHFLVNATKFKLNAGWEDCSEKEELSKLEKYKVWLNNELGNQRNFDWGTVWASYDRKGGFSSMGIRYKQLTTYNSTLPKAAQTWWQKLFNFYQTLIIA